MRPASIVQFERFYLGSIGVGLINVMLTWRQTEAMLSDPALNPEGFGSGLMLSIMAFSFAIPILLWYLIAKRASNVAKWIMVVLFAIGLLMLVPSLMGPLAPTGIGLFLTLATTALQGYAVFMLFKPDAVAWLSDGRGPTNPDTFR